MLYNERWSCKKERWDGSQSQWSFICIRKYALLLFRRQQNGKQKTFGYKEYGKEKEGRGGVAFDYGKNTIFYNVSSESSTLQRALHFQ